MSTELSDAIARALTWSCRIPREVCMKPMIGPKDANPAPSNHLAKTIQSESGGVYYKLDHPTVEYPPGGRFVGYGRDRIWTPGFVMHKWPMDEFKALSRMLVKFGFYGEHRADRIVSLYRSGLHLPLETDNDWVLLENAVKHAPPRTKPATELTPSMCWLEQLEAINPQKAREYQ